MIGEHDDNHRMLPWVAFFIILVILSLGVLLLIIYFTNRGGQVIGSSEEPVTSEPSSIPVESSTSIYDDYIDVTKNNIKKYIKSVGEKSLSTSWTVKDIYTVNMYVDSGTSILVYGFSISEETDKYIRIEIDIEKELSSMEEVVSLIHDDSISIDMYIGNTLYTKVDDDLVSKDSFCSLYDGEYKYGITYKDDGDQYYYSGIGINKEDYLCIDNLSYDHSSYDIDNGGTHTNSSSNGRYKELLVSLG